MKGKENVVNEPRHTEPEAAVKLGVHRVTLTRWRLRGLIGFYRIGPRIYYGDGHLNEFLARCERKPKAIREAA